MINLVKEGIRGRVEFLVDCWGWVVRVLVRLGSLGKGFDDALG